MPKLILAFRNFVNAPKKDTGFYLKLQISYTSYTSVEYYDFRMVYDKLQNAPILRLQLYFRSTCDL